MVSAFESARMSQRRSSVAGIASVLIVNNRFYVIKAQVSPLFSGDYQIGAGDTQLVSLK